MQNAGPRPEPDERKSNNSNPTSGHLKRKILTETRREPDETNGKSSNYKATSGHQERQVKVIDVEEPRLDTDKLRAEEPLDNIARGEIRNKQPSPRRVFEEVREVPFGRSGRRLSGGQIRRFGGPPDSVRFPINKRIKSEHFGVPGGPGPIRAVLGPVRGSPWTGRFRRPNDGRRDHERTCARRASRS